MLRGFKWPQTHAFLIICGVSLLLAVAFDARAATGAPVITSHPQSVTVAPGATATFTVAATGTGPITYQWRKNAVAIAGATNASYSLSSVKKNDEGSCVKEIDPMRPAVSH